MAAVASPRRIGRVRRAAKINRARRWVDHAQILTPPGDNSLDAHTDRIERPHPSLSIVLTHNGKAPVPTPWSRARLAPPRALRAIWSSLAQIGGHRGVTDELAVGRGSHRHSVDRCPGWVVGEWRR